MFHQVTQAFLRLDIITCTSSLLAQILESQLKIKQQQVQELETTSGHLERVDPDKRETILAKKVQVQERCVAFPKAKLSVMLVYVCRGCLLDLSLYISCHCTW